MPRLRTLAVAISVVALLGAQHVRAVANEAERITKRQGSPPDLSTSSINWWPYPAYQSWDGATSTSITDPATLTPFSSFMAAASLTTDSTGGTPSLTSTTNPTASAITPGSIVSITALPPAATPRRYIRRPTATGFNIAYLAPLFAVIGVAVGMLVAWLVFALARGRWRPRARVSVFKPGPKYAPPSRFVSASEGPATTDEENRGSRFLGLMRSGRTRSSRDPCSAEDEKQPSWIQRHFSSHKREPAAPSHTPAVGYANAHHVDDSLAEDAPFLHASEASPARYHTPYDTDRAAPSPTPVARSPPGPDVFSDGVDQDVLHDTIRHKSIRRSILERFKSNSRYRGGHKRADSDVTIGQVQGAEPSAAPLLGERTPSRASSSSSGSSRPQGNERVLSLVNPDPSGPGFRLVQEDTGSRLPSPSQEGGMLGLNWTLPWVASPDKLNMEDKFTALPSRKNLAEKRASLSPVKLVPQASSSSATTSVSEDEIEDLQAGLVHVDSGVLPTSPPRVTSPPLEAQLFFGAIPQKFGETPHLDFVFNSPNQVPVAGTPFKPSPLAKVAKSHSQRASPPLPFPSTKRNSPYRARLQKSPAQRAKSQRAAESPQTFTVRVESPAAGLLDRESALDKVDQIIARSWQDREKRGEPLIRSPTMYGAAPAASHEEQDGIEQRLLAP